jgi:serine protease
MPSFFYKAILVLLLTYVATVQSKEVIKSVIRADVIPNQYIVTLKDKELFRSLKSQQENPSASLKLAIHQSVSLMKQQLNFHVDKSFYNAIKGGVYVMDESTAQKMANHPLVNSVEEDSVIYLLGAGSQTKVETIYGDFPLPWGLDRIDQVNNTLNSLYQWQNDGTGVKAYIIDTGVSNPAQLPDEFEDRLLSGFNTIDNSPDATDCMGHGTKVASIAAGLRFGVSKKVKVVPLRVFGCSGLADRSHVIQAMEWTIVNQQLSPSPAVINMSISMNNSYGSVALDTAFKNVIAANILPIVSGGNNSTDACAWGSRRGLTVGATARDDSIAYFSNIGKCIDLFAPGRLVNVATVSSLTSTVNGTSFSAPHVTGIAANYLSQYPNLTAKQLKAAIIQHATVDQIDDVQGSPNRIANSTLFGHTLRAPDAKTNTISIGANREFTLSWNNYAVEDYAKQVEIQQRLSGGSWKKYKTTTLNFIGISKNIAGIWEFRVRYQNVLGAWSGYGKSVQVRVLSPLPPVEDCIHRLCI